MTNWQARNVVFGIAFVDTVLAALKTVASAALIATAKVRLSTDTAFNPTPNVTISALAAHEAAYTGYTAGGVAAVLSAPVNPSTVVLGVLIPALFIATSSGSFVPATVTGWWLDDGTNFICGEAFGGGNTANFGQPGDFLDLTVVVPFGLQQSTT